MVIIWKALCKKVLLVKSDLVPRVYFLFSKKNLKNPRILNFLNKRKEALGTRLGAMERAVTEECEHRMSMDLTVTTKLAVILLNFSKVRFLEQVIFKIPTKCLEILN